MELSEEEFTQRYAKQCKNCSKKTLLPYEYEFTYNVRGYNVKQRQKELSETIPSRKKTIFLTD